MTSEAKIAANRRNAQRSMGPRTAPGKARVRRNALKHGLAARLLRDFGEAAEGERIAAAICASELDSIDREQAQIIAETQAALGQVRRIRAQIMEEPASAPFVDHLLRLERYEQRALSRRKRAVRMWLRDGGR